MNSRIYSGKVVHTRFTPARHGFTTSVGFMAIDLKDFSEIDRDVKGFAVDRFSAVSLHASDYLHPEPIPLLEKLKPWIEGLNLETAPECITLVTSPKWWGRAFNPVSFYLLHSSAGELLGLISEVNNTFGDRHIYAVRLEKKEGIAQAGHAKEFHVSPFNNMEGSYQFTVREAGPELYIGVDLYRDGEKILESWIEGCGEPLTSRSLWKHYARHPFRPWLTMPKIVLQALFLRYRHKLNVFKRPEPKHPHSLLSRHHPRV